MPLSPHGTTSSATDHAAQAAFEALLGQGDLLLNALINFQGAFTPPPFLTGDEGDRIYLLSPAAATGHGGTTTTTSTSGTASSTLTGTAGHLQINLMWDASVSSAPAGFKTAVIYAAQYFESIISSNEKLNIQVGYGEVGGTTLGAGVLGAAGPYGINESYASYKSQFAAHATSADQQTVLANMSSTDPTHGANIFVATGEAKALGLLSTYTGVDGVMGFAVNTNNLFTYDPAHRAVAGEYDFIGVAEHELSHALGRIAILSATQVTPLDLLRYSAPGVHDLGTSVQGYFSINGGTTNLDWYATSSDLGDWASSAGYDANTAYAAIGVQNNFTHVDVQQLNALGYALV